ncbi:ribosome maturation factor RimP [Arthrobacter sp. CAN_C5]|uniref:ribosome maturation factor RimP n=1 Tax=Arthrobacter sp. CAN_C5 TaxID=2760706 RepID=UPI001AE88C05|nr:ribosome maturation factor RimP [Arthrobacter sp. CAN_C5]MBP2217567.1 ribosome maturation factor RimP [Arthrobacter sp. CAN_C5]
MAVRPGNDSPPAASTLQQQARDADNQVESTRLTALLQPTVEQHGLFLEAVEIKSAGSERMVNVVVDLPEDQTGSVNLDLISDVAHDVSLAMDADTHDHGRPYSLEVSSPGVSRPLTEPRHWRRNVGRMVTVRQLKGDDITGRLLEVSGDSVRLTPQIPVKKGMKPKTGDPLTLPLAGIRKGTVQVEFAHLDDTHPDESPLDDSGDEGTFDDSRPTTITPTASEN